MTKFDCDGNPEFEWTPFHEVHLIHAMGGVRFLGINKHFKLFHIIEKFYAGIGNGSGITWEEIIKKIKTYYNLNFEKRVFTDVFPEEEFSLDESILSEYSAKDSEVLTDESSVGGKSETESLSNSGGESGSKRGKSVKKESTGRRSVTTGSNTPHRKSDSKAKEESTKKMSTADKKRLGAALKEPASKKMRLKE